MRREKNALVKGCLQYGIATAVGLAIAVPLAFFRGFQWGQGAWLSARYWSDGFFVAGLLLTGIGGLTLISTTGFFDIFGYAVQSLLVLFSSLKHPGEHVKYFDYKTAKAEKRGKGSAFLLWVGLVFIGLAGLCLTLYYNLPPGA